MLQNVALKLQQPFTIVKIEQVSGEATGFKPQKQEIERIEARGTIRPLDVTKLQNGKLDFSLDYIQIHTKEKAEIGDLIEYAQRIFSVIASKESTLWGFYRIHAQECKEE